ncbi:PREDICTED: carbohydrate sulfotransferase 14-like, partial [Priapulus caudatus]|uniref:Carbohydrate sulfotransferase n=1 Tax=Priapulus caudatus TaxID=37621 RepID=A0ABM1EVY0_PRICU
TTKRGRLERARRNDGTSQPNNGSTPHRQCPLQTNPLGGAISREATLQAVKERKRRVRRVCDKYGNGVVDAGGALRDADVLLRYVNNVYVNDELRLLYCSIPKIGSTNWKRVLLALRSNAAVDPASIDKELAHKRSNVTTLSKLGSAARRRRLKHYYKFMFIRDPYERLLSAYMDKFGQPNPYFQKTYGKTIIRRYRHNATRAALVSGRNVTFVEFLTYLSRPTSFHDDPEIRAIYRHSGHNRHWARYMDLCNPCSVDYDFIGDYANIEAEAQIVLEESGLAGVVEYPTRSGTNYSRPRTSQLVANMYASVPDALLRVIEQIYAIDFELFGFDFMRSRKKQ